MIRWLIRLTATPALIILRILEWCAIYIVQYAGIMCRFISGAIFVLAIIGFISGLGNREYLIKILAVGFGFFLIPQFGGIIVKSIVLTQAALENLIQN